ncbi:MAG: PilZ domain-containing protein [Thermoanaerobaculales bacterium]
MRQTLLILGTETPALHRIVPILRRADFDTYQAVGSEEALELLQDVRFDLIIVRYPLTGVPLAELVARLREAGSAGRHASLLLLADISAVGEVASFLGRGVNRVVSIDAPSERLLEAVADLLSAEPRRTLRAVIQLDIRVEGGQERTLTLVENVSPTGLLVRGCREFPIGSRLRFELLFPDGGEPARGELEVVRHTDRERERVDGFGARIVTFTGDGEQRLRSFLDGR